MATRTLLGPEKIATTSSAGLLSAADKSKLDNLIDDTAGASDTSSTWSADKLTTELSTLSGSIPSSISDLTDDSDFVTNTALSALLGANSGIAELDSAGKVPSSQLPSYVDDVEEYNALASFPVEGESGKIYIDTATNITYRWGGSTYVPIGSDLALGTTESTAFRGDYGAAAYAHAVTNKGSAYNSGLYKITTNSEGHVTGATAVEKADITTLGIPGSDTDTHRPIQVAGTQILGDNTTPLNFSEGSNITLSESNGTITIAATDTTYSSLSASDSGTDVSLVTTGEKYIWNNKIDNSEKGAASGIATLDANGKVPNTQLPDYVDDVLEYLSVSAFPATGESGIIYVDTTANTTYRWDGSTYVQIGSTYSSLSAAENGTDVSLVTTGEKYIWNSKADGSHTHNYAGSSSAGGAASLLDANTAIGDADRPIWFSYMTSGGSIANGKLAYNTNFQYNPSTTTLTIGNGTLTGTNYSGTAAKATADADGNTISSTYLKLSGGTLTGGLTRKTDADASLANNGVSGISYPTTFNILDKNERIITRLEGIIETNGNISANWYVRNYDTSGTQTGHKGIKMTMAKDGTLTYTISDPDKFRSAISVPSTTGTNASGSWDISITGTAAKATGDADGNAIASTYIKKSIGTAAGDIIYWSASGTPARLAKGSNGQVLKINSSGLPAWAADSNSDTNVSQSASTTTNWRKILLHYKDDTTSTTAVTSSTNVVYAAVDVSVQPSTGTVRANAFKIKDNCTLQWNSTDQSVDFVFA